MKLFDNIRQFQHTLKASLKYQILEKKQRNFKLALNRSKETVKTQRDS